jgi:hypothetical protein
MVQVVILQRVELAEPDSGSWQGFQTLLTAAAAVDGARLVHMPPTLGADTVSLPTTCDKLNERTLCFRNMNQALVSVLSAVCLWVRACRIA